MFNLTDLLNKAADLIEDTAEKGIKTAEQQFALADLLNDPELRERLTSVIEDITDLGEDLLDRVADIFDIDLDEDDEPEVPEATDPLRWDITFNFPKSDDSDLFDLLTGGLYKETSEPAPEKAPEPEPEVKAEEEKIQTFSTPFGFGASMGLSAAEIEQIKKFVEDLSKGDGFKF